MKPYAFVTLLLLSACAPARAPIELSPLELRAMETRDYDVQDPKLVMKAVVDVLQDEGFEIRNAAPDIGLLTATKETDVERRTFGLLGAFFDSGEGVWEKISVLEATLNISRIAHGARIRVSFQRKSVSNKGTPLGTSEIRDSTFYRSFFAKVERGLFYQREAL
jgi:hypothetical protein